MNEVKTKVFLSKELLDGIKSHLEEFGLSASIIVEEFLGEKILSEEYPNIVVSSKEEDVIYLPPYLSSVVEKEPESRTPWLSEVKGLFNYCVPSGSNCITIHFTVGSVLQNNLKNLIIFFHKKLLQRFKKIQSSLEVNRNSWKSFFNSSNLLGTSTIPEVLRTENYRVWFNGYEYFSNTFEYLLFNLGIANTLYKIRAKEKATRVGLKSLLKMIHESDGSLDGLAINLRNSVSGLFKVHNHFNSSELVVRSYVDDGGEEYLENTYYISKEDFEVPLFHLASLRSVTLNQSFVKRFNSFILEQKIKDNVYLNLDYREIEIGIGELVYRLKFFNEFSKETSEEFYNSLFDFLGSSISGLECAESNLKTLTDKAKLTKLSHFPFMIEKDPYFRS